MREALRREGALAAPSVGQWVPRIVEGAALKPGVLLGWLRQLGVDVPIVAPKGSRGAAVQLAKPMSWLAYGDAICREGALGEEEVVEAAVDEGGPEGSRAVRALTDGTVFLRPAPDQPAFVDVGQRIAVGDTLALVEVMKTFTPIRAEQAGEVLQVDVDDGSSVAEGAVLMWVR